MIFYRKQMAIGNLPSNYIDSMLIWLIGVNLLGPATCLHPWSDRVLLLKPYSQGSSNSGLKPNSDSSTIGDLKPAGGSAEKKCQR